MTDDPLLLCPCQSCVPNDKPADFDCDEIAEAKAIRDWEPLTIAEFYEEDEERTHAVMPLDFAGAEQAIRISMD